MANNTQTQPGGGKQPAIVVDQAVLGGISDSVYMGKPGSLAEIVGLNLHKVPGLMITNQALSQYSPANGPAAVDDLVKSLHCSDGKARLFGKNSGKIWEIDQNGVFTQPAVIPLISDAATPTTVANDTSVGSTAGAIMDIALHTPGTGYSAGDVLTVAGGTGGTVTVLTVDPSTGAILTLQVNANGHGYSTGTNVATSYGGAGINATIDIVTVNNMDWVAPGYAETEDGITSSFRTGNGLQSHYLKATGFNFNIPNDAIITGIIVEIKENRAVDGSPATWYITGGSVKLVKGGTITGNDKGNQGSFTDSLVENRLGDSQDLWGLSLTPTDVNASNFGVAISRSGIWVTANIDVVRIRVCYTRNGRGSPVLDAREYEGPGGDQYVYYALPNFLGMYKIGDPLTTRNDSFGKFQNGNKLAHPMREQNLVLFIGDGNVVAQVDASGERNIPFSPTTFSPMAVRIKSDEYVNCLRDWGSKLLIGSKNVTNLNLCHLYNWDTFSPSFDQSDPIPENGVNAFMPDKIRVIISVGENGNFYEYVHSFYGLYLQPLEQVPPNYPQLYDNNNKAIIYPGAVDTLQNIPIFGFSRLSGNPALQGIYTLGSRDTTYPVILTLEYAVSTGRLQNLTIWSVEVVGNDIFVSYMDETNQEFPVYRYDKIDWNKKATVCYFKTMIVKYTKVLMDRFKDFVVGYDQLPAGTSIDFYYNKNKEGWVKFNTAENPDEFISQAGTDGETDPHMYKATQTIQGRTMQFMVVVNAVGNTAPNLEDMSALMS